MKKIVLIIVFAVLGISNAKAQEKKTSLVGGYTNMEITVKADYQGESFSEDEDVSGFFIGLTHDVNLSNNLKFQPGFLYTRVSEGGESDNFIQVPLLLKYQTSDVFSLLAGPKIDYLTGLTDAEKELVNEFLFSLAVGVEIKIIDSLAFIGNYSFQLNSAFADEYTDAIESEGADISGRYGIFNVGLAYKF